MRLLRWTIIAAAIASISVPVLADTYIEEIPTAWRLQDFTGGVVVAYYTGSSASSCPNGVIQFSGSATVDDRNRFWSLVMTAKATNHKVGISFDGGCNITSFYEV